MLAPAPFYRQSTIIMTQPDLSGIKILITRPLAQAEAWATELERLGATTVIQPFLAIEALNDKSSTQATNNLLLRLDEYQKAIFVSQNAVDYGIEWIDQFWPQLPIRLDFFAVGQSTAKHLENKLYYLGVSVEAPQHAMNSEALLALNSLKCIQGEKVIIFRGQGGREHLGKSLEARGALVDYCEVYQRILPEFIDREKIAELLAQAHDEKQITVISAHSGETLKNMCTALDQHELNWIQQQALLIPGERVATIATQLGFKQIITAENATHESMIEALHDWRQHSR